MLKNWSLCSCMFSLCIAIGQSSHAAPINPNDRVMVCVSDALPVTSGLLRISKRIEIVNIDRDEKSYRTETFLFDKYKKKWSRLESRQTLKSEMRGHRDGIQFIHDGNSIMTVLNEKRKKIAAWDRKEMRMGFETQEYRDCAGFSKNDKDAINKWLKSVRIDRPKN